MAGIDFFIRPATGTTSSDWIRIPNTDIKVKLTRRITRTIVRGGEGDNLHDEGSESTVYSVSGEIGIDEYKNLISIFRTGQPFIHDPFEERDVKVVFASMEYNSDNESFALELIEDIV
jgi:hypothetical protein